MLFYKLKTIFRNAYGNVNQTFMSSVLMDEYAIKLNSKLDQIIRSGS